MNIHKLITEGPSRVFAGALLEDLAQMERELAAACPGSGELNGGLARILGAGGKRLRPLLAWVCWHAGPEDGEKKPIVPLMTMLELMHTTSLIHDDFVDGAALRRGVATISAAEGGMAALRSGDYLLSRAMEPLELYRDTGINEALSLVSQEMCLGELDQNAGLFRAGVTTEERYFSRIRRKTALLMAESCRSGARAGGLEEGAAEALWTYGLHLGLAFQLRDDLGDFAPSEETGKPPLQDLRSGVVTLPLILALEGAEEPVLAAAEKQQKSGEDVDMLLGRIRKTKAMEKTRARLHRECGAAAEALSPLPAGPERDSLLLLAKTISEVKTRG